MSKSDRSKDVRYWATHHLPLIRDGWYTDGRTCGDATSITVLIDGPDGLSICSSWPTKIEIDAAGGIAQWAADRRTGVELEEASTESGDLEWAAELFAEYADSIADIAGPSLQYQGFASELSSLPGAYGRPRGCIFLAIVNYRPVGCIALRPLPALGPDVCELKRMYVRPKFRKRGIARMLANRLIAEARAIGYRTMKLDTSDTMHAAIALYRSLGFVPCERYNDDPMDDTLWFELKL
jgi:GNAT superfamily N-acetyltransferase